jgi:hypothetical protein
MRSKELLAGAPSPNPPIGLNSKELDITAVCPQPAHFFWVQLKTFLSQWPGSATRAQEWRISLVKRPGLFNAALIDVYYSTDAPPHAGRRFNTRLEVASALGLALGPGAQTPANDEDSKFPPLAGNPSCLEHFAVAKEMRERLIVSQQLNAYRGHCHHIHLEVPKTKCSPDPFFSTCLPVCLSTCLPYHD